MHSMTHALRVLRQGGVIVYPTETSYALGCDARSKRGVAAIFKLKGRASEKKLPVIAGSYTQARCFFKWNKHVERLARHYWPGPLTILLEPKKSLPVSRGGGVAVRVSSDEVARRLARGLGAPLVSTSANVSGKPACFSVLELKKQFGSRLKDVVIIDAGVLKPGKPSTIVRLTADGIVEVIRYGSVLVFEAVRRRRGLVPEGARRRGRNERAAGSARSAAEKTNTEQLKRC